MADERQELLELRRLSELEAKSGIPSPRDIGPAPPQRPGVGMRLVGSGETVLGMLSGGLIEPAAGLAGLYEGVSGLVRGDADALKNASDTIQNIRRAGTYEPRTEAGRQIQQMVTAPFQKFGEATKQYGGLAQDVSGGSPLAGTIAQSVPEMAVSLLGARSKGPTMRQRAADVGVIRQSAKDIGFDMSAPAEAQGAQLVKAAEGMTGGRTSVAQDFDQLQASVMKAREIAKEEVSKLYDDARSTSAGISVAQARDFSDIANRALADFDVQDMPIVKRRLDELAEVAALPDNAIVKLNAVAQYRQRINRNRPATTDLAQNAALGILKGEMDNFLDAQFNADMITGNPQAIIKWKMANGAYKAYAETFNDNKVVRQLGTQQATPEEIRNWIFGANAVGAKKQAGDVVARIKKIVGEDSPSFMALRQDALLDITKPLLDESPNYGQFAKNYDRFMRNNPSLAKELFPESVSDLDKMRAFAGAMEKDASRRISIDMNQALSRIMFGHGIAKAAMKVSIAGQAINYMRRAAGRSEQTRIMGDILGYDPGAPVLPATPIAISGIVQSSMTEQQ